MNRLRTKSWVVILPLLFFFACERLEVPRQEEPVTEGKVVLSTFETLTFEEMERLIMDINVVEQYKAQGYIIKDSSVWDHHGRVLLVKHSDTTDCYIEVLQSMYCTVSHLFDATRYDADKALVNATIRTIWNEREYNGGRSVYEYEAYIPGEDITFERNRTAITLDSVYAASGKINHFIENTSYYGSCGTGIVLHTLPAWSRIIQEEQPNMYDDITYDSVVSIGYNLTLSN